MTAAGNVPVTHTGLCWHALQKLPGLLEAFTREIDGVKEGQDIEYIHRMRVASRRLRAALPLFRICFADNQYRKWLQEITQITRALGDARDADVQIAFLQKTQKKFRKNPACRKKILRVTSLPGNLPYSSCFGHSRKNGYFFRNMSCRLLPTLKKAG